MSFATSPHLASFSARCSDATHFWPKLHKRKIDMRWFFLIFMACILVTTLRNTLVVTAPLLFWDDVIIFNNFYNGKMSLLAVYPDYISWAPNIIFSVVFSLFKTQHLSMALEAITIIIYSAFSAFFALPMFDAIVLDPKKRVIICLWIAVMPVSDQSLIEISAYQNCSCMIPLFLGTALIAATALSDRRGPHAGWLALLVPCTLANPLSVCTMPLNAASALLRFRRGGFRAALTPAILALTGLIAAALVGVTASASGGHTTISIASLIGVGGRSLLFMLDRGFVEALIGSPARQVVLDALPPLGPGLAPAWLYGTALALVVAGTGAAWKWTDAPTSIFAGTLLILAAGYSFLALVSLGPLRGLSSESTEVLTTLGRYWFIQKICMLVALGTVLANTPLFAPRLGRGAVGVVVLGLLLAYSANANTGSRYGLSARDDPRRRDREIKSAIQLEFLKAVRTAERNGIQGCFLERGDGSSPLLRLYLPRGQGAPTARDAECAVR